MLALAFTHIVIQPMNSHLLTIFFFMGLHVIPTLSTIGTALAAAILSKLSRNPPMNPVSLLHKNGNNTAA
jgi:hypothetical protein